MKLVAQNDNVVCRQINKTHETENSLIVYEKENLPIYEIVDVSCKLKDKYSVGDNIICNSTGTKVDVDNCILFIFKEENIAGKVY